MIKGGKIWAQPPICKVAKPQYVFYSTSCTWHLYENIKQEESSNLYRNSWQGRPAFSISTHIEAHIRNTSSHFQDIQSFKYEIQEQKRKHFVVFLSNMSLGFDLEPDEDAICFYFISTEIHPPMPRFVIFFDNDL